MLSNVRRLLMLFVAVVCCCGNITLYAQNDAGTLSASMPSEQVKQLLAPIEPLIGKNTFVVAHVDLTRINIEKISTHWKEIVNMLADKVKANEDIANMLNKEGIDIDQMVNDYMVFCDENFARFQKEYDNERNAGLKEIYVLSNASLMMIVPVQMVLIVEKGTVDDVLEQFAFTESLHYEKSDEMVIVSAAGEFGIWDFENETDIKKFERILAQVKPFERPEIIAGFEKVKDAPVKIVFAPDAVLRGMLSMGLAMVPPPYNEVDTKTINAGIKWVAVGIDPMQNEAAVTIQSDSPEASQQLHDLILNTYNDEIERQLDNIPGDDEVVDSIRKIAQLVTGFFPKVNGDQLQWILDKQFLEKQADVFLAKSDILIPFIIMAGKTSRDIQCQNHLKQILLAMHNHHAARNALPAVYTADSDGKPLHSWRVALLPYMEELELYNKIKLDEPWDSEYNKQFHDCVPRVYQCPEHAEKGMTNYSVVVGKKCFFNDSQEKSFVAIPDGSSNTIAVVERTTPVCWMDPTREITFEEACKGINVEDSENGIGNKHGNDGVNVAFFDGSVTFIPEMIDLEILRALLTNDGGERVYYQH